MTGPGLPSGGKAEYSRVTGSNNEPLSDLIAKVEIKDSGGTVLASSVKSYESQRDLIESVENKWGMTTVSKYAYKNDDLARRSSVVRTGSAFTGGTGDHQELYTYNARNELTGAHTYEGDDLEEPGSEIVARRRGYSYDPIGNRLTHTNGDDDDTSYTSNNLNQYTEICPPPLPPVCAAQTYDADGNLTSDANWNYYWDLENRLSFVVAKTPGEGAKYYQYDYDYLNRRIRKRTFEWVCPEPQEGCVCGVYSGSCNIGDWDTTASQDIRYVYDGWNLLMEVDALDSNAILRKYTWGLDLSGTIQGAGGIGGLLAVEDDTGSIGLPPVKLLYFSDANGNVGQLVDVSDGSITARYEYDPYGNLVNSAGNYANANPFCFSTKYLDLETGSYYFGYRYYSAEFGRWTSRDPLGEWGDSNLHRYADNTPLCSFDARGQWNDDMHFDETLRLAAALMSEDCADRIARWDIGVDRWTGAALFPWFHFDYDVNGQPFAKGRQYWFMTRWQEGVGILARTESCDKVRYALHKIGEALHSFQDGFTHREGGEDSHDEYHYPHRAETPFDHAPRPICTLMGDPYGVWLPRCRNARTQNPGNWKNPHRPDTKELFPNDWQLTSQKTDALLRSLLEYRGIQCCCKKQMR